MASTKKTAPAAGVARPSWPISTVFDHADQAWGARFVRAGFAVAPELDAPFALGWPHAVTFVEAHPDDADPVAALKKWPDYPNDGWPREVAARSARLRALKAFRRTPAGEIVFSPEGERIAKSAGPISTKELPKLLESMLCTTEFREDLRDAAQILEAFVGPEAFANATVDALEKAPNEALAQKDVERNFVVKHLGFALLRTPAKTTDALRARLAKLLDKPAAKNAKPGSLVRYVDVVLNGRAGFERSSAKQSVHDIMHVYDDPAFVHEKVLAQDPNFLLPDARLLFLGGADLAKLYSEKLPKLKGQHARIVREIGAVRSPEVIELIRKIAAGKEAKAEAQAWLQAFGG